MDSLPRPLQHQMRSHKNKKGDNISCENVIAGMNLGSIILLPTRSSKLSAFSCRALHAPCR